MKRRRGIVCVVMIVFMTGCANYAQVKKGPLVK